MKEAMPNDKPIDGIAPVSQAALRAAEETLRIESAAALNLIGRLNASFQRAVSWIAQCRGRVVICGMGKSGIIGRKLAATLASTGTPSLWMHSAEAAHGDLGQLTRDDILVLISNSGETEETKRLAPLAKKI